MRLFTKIALIASLATPTLTHAVGKSVDYEALTHKVRKSVYIHQHKRGVSLNGHATKSLLTQSFIGQLVKAPLAELEPHLLYACGMPDLYDEASENLDLDSRVKVSRSALFLAARKFDSKNRFPTKKGMKLKKLYKIDDKKMKYFRKHWDRNKYLPQTATKELGEVNQWVSDSALVLDIRGKCEMAMTAAIASHEAPILKFIEDTINSNVETAVK